MRGAATIVSAAELVSAAPDRLQALADQKAADAGNYSWNKARQAMQNHGRTAFLIVLSATLLPIAYKLLAFFVLAPFAARTPPLRLLGEGAGLRRGASGISAEIAIDRDDELLLRSGLQSSAADIGGADRYVLDWAMPLTCLAAGLVNLQRLRSERPDHVVVTGTDEDQRVAAIVVPQGGAVVLQPRALLGLVKPRTKRLVVTRHWRLTKSISWITGRFRHVVFHGPCTLIFQGRDGVLVENASSGRMIDRSLTLGFDAKLAYGAARSLSFLPFLRGRASLFNDRFGGEGRYLYQQRAAGVSRYGVLGRGLKGLGDALLGAFGI